MPGQLTTTKPSLKFVVTSFLLGMILLHMLVMRMVWSQAMGGRPDYKIFYTAALILKRGWGRDLYDNRLQLQVQKEFPSWLGEGEGPLPYNHPPFEAALHVPLAYFSYLEAYAIWTGLNFLLLGWFVWFFRSQVPILAREFPSILFLSALGFFPLVFGLMQGQDSTLLMVLYGLAFVALKSGREFRAGLLLGAGLFKFHLVLPFVFILLLRRRWTAVGGFAVSGALAALASLALVGWKELLYYPRYVWEVNRHPPMRVIVPQNMANLRGLVTGWRWPHSAIPWLDGVVMIASLALLVWAAWRWDPADRSDIRIWTCGFSICVIATFLACYHGYNQDMSILYPPLLLLADQLLREGWREWQKRRVAFFIAVMFFSPVYLILTVHFQHENLFTFVLLFFVASLAAWTSAMRAGTMKGTEATARLHPAIVNGVN